jgi:hypothetical protein
MKNITAINLYETKKKKKQAHSDLLIYNLELPLANSIRVSHTIHVILLNGNPYPLSQKKITRLYTLIS